MEASPQYTVLRIKRKATEAPLSSLVIQDPSNRVKKRRDVSGKPRGVFRLAETVPPTWEGLGEEGEALKTRIKGLMASEPRKSEDERSTSSHAAEAEAGPSRRPVENLDDGHRDPRRDPSVGKPETSGGVGPAPIAKTYEQPTKTQYKVIPPMSPRSRLMLPPKVYSYKEVETGRLVFVDAQAVEAAQAQAQGRSILPPASLGAEEDKEMAAFQAMLKEYLSLEKPERPASHVHDQPSSAVDDGYVYDLYYRDLRPPSPSKRGLGIGDGVTPASIGALLGYEDFSPPSTPSDSEIEDEADEDSNEEDFYRNDYPEDENADSDMQDLEDRDELWSDDSDGDGGTDGNGGGMWDYR